ncbi:MAG: hypothetical protein DME61_01215 [Verrucomicrobia bacterium]|nr:MAG: hypothetical protein DME61_01215 [Verrucomicrobiota bacterium]PYL69399.1 MAG: hypothetical protein DMF28_03450 [Verrucomicrobiota bacterium]
MQITVSAASPQVPKKCKNTYWKLEDDPQFGDWILHSLMRIRTDFDQFTDTEIYALGYCGDSIAVFALLHTGLIKQEAVWRSRSTRDPIRKYYGWALKAVAA